MKLSLKFKIEKISLVLWGVIGGRFIEPLTVIIISGYYLSKNKEIKCSSTIIYSFLILFVYGLLSSLYNHYSLYKLIQQCFVLLILFLSYDIIFKSLKGNVDYIFSKYLNIAYYVSVLGVFQLSVSVLFHFNIFFFISGISTLTRTTSLFIEPGFLGQFLIPAFVAIIFSKDFRNEYKFKSIIIVICYILSFSAIAYFIALLAALGKIYAKYNSKLAKIGSIIIILLIIVIMWSLMKANYQSSTSTRLGQINVKIVETQQMFSIANPDEFSEINLSSFALASNLYVARNAPCRILGTGLGSHESNYNKVYQGSSFNITLNTADGYSIFIRIFSEFGYIGLFAYLFWIYKKLNSKNIINMSVFFFLISILLRGGHYYLYGIVFFHFLYFYTSKKRMMTVKSKWNI